MSFNSLVGIGASSANANCTGHYPMQESTGTSALDYSGNSRHGTQSGMGANPTTDTGPNAWLPSAYDFDGSDDQISLPAAVATSGAGERTYSMWVKAKTGADVAFADFGDGASTNGRWLVLTRKDSETGFRIACFGHVLSPGTSTFSTGTWYFVSVRVPASSTSTSDVDFLINAVDQTLSTVTGSAQTLDTDVSAVFIGQANGSKFPGYIAGVDCRSTSLSDAEIAELKNGPEPENTVAPTVSGDTAQGSTLTCSPGTWALPSPYSGGTNGTITYTYQWTRDGGDISGATSSTYVTQAADIGTAVGCKVLGVNDGGSDSAEQTASSNTISVVSSTTYRMNMQLFIPTQV